MEVNMLYFVNKNAQANGDHEVHTSECRHIPDEENRMYLGDFNHCVDAVREAKKCKRLIKRLLTFD